MTDYAEKASKTPYPGKPRNTPETAIGKVIQYYRTQLDISQEELSKVCGLGRNAINEIERGKRKKLQRGTVTKVIGGLNAQGLEVTIEEFDAKVEEFDFRQEHKPAQYNPSIQEGEQDFTNILLLISSARKIIADNHINSRARIVEGITLCLDLMESLKGQTFKDKSHLDIFSNLVVKFDGFVREEGFQDIINRNGSLFPWEEFLNKLGGFQRHLSETSNDIPDGIIQNDWDEREFKHSKILNELLLEIDHCIDALKLKPELLPDETKRKTINTHLNVLKLELHSNPLSLAKINELGRDLEEFKLDIFKEIIIGSQLILGSYAERLVSGSVFRDQRELPELVIIPTGKFIMGSEESEGNKSESPQSKVVLGYRFAVGRYPVTFEEWDFYSPRNSDAHKPDDEGQGRGRRPVINVSWDDAQGYVKWLSVVTGKKYRLLSEAEWEYSCRAGTETEYSFGDTITAKLAEYREGDEPKYNEIIPVGSFEPNSFGLCDMHGNVWEWCEDHWHNNYNGAPVDGSAWSSSSDEYPESRILRGGSWNASGEELRARARAGLHRGTRNITTGFRVARDL